MDIVKRKPGLITSMHEEKTLLLALEVISTMDMRPPKRPSGSTRGAEKALNSYPMPKYLCGKDFPDRVPPQRQ